MAKKVIKEYRDQMPYQVAPAKNVNSLPIVKGYNFDEKFDFNKFIKSYSTTGAQATNLGRAIEIVKEMQAKKVTIFLGYTSNMSTTGIRDIIRYLAQHKKVDVLVTTGGGVEEDIIKVLKPFHIGTFSIPGKELLDKGINRAGNVFIPNDRYLAFEDFINPLLERLYKEQKEKNIIHSSVDITRELGKEIGKHKGCEESVLYWAYKNNIPVFCPAIMDGSFGDLVYFMCQRKSDFKIDVTNDTKKIVDIALNANKSGAIILGAGLIKHFILNANIFREGLDYAVYINTAQEYDGSDSGALPEEAISWGKVSSEANHIKVFADATIVFPLIVASAFKE